MQGLSENHRTHNLLFEAFNAIGRIINYACLTKNYYTCGYQLQLNTSILN
jgi:hypothetical protein